MCRYPLHLVEVENNICKIQPPVTVEIFVDAIMVGIKWGDSIAREGDYRRHNDKNT